LARENSKRPLLPLPHQLSGEIMQRIYHAIMDVMGLDKTRIAF